MRNLKKSWSPER